MNPDNLVRMANRIGDFFAAMPDREEALQGIAQHIERFWEPRMRSALLQHIDQGHAASLRPEVLAAVQRHRTAMLGGRLVI